MPAIDISLPPRSSLGPVPQRPMGSVRRTSSIDVTWPQGMDGSMRFTGRARDLVTPLTDRRVTTIAEDSFTASLRQDWTIDSIASEPMRPSLEALVGKRGNNGFRKALQEVLPKEQDTPLRLVLEDIPGATIVSGVAWEQWERDWMMKAFGDLPMEVLLKAREGVCIGHAPGSSAQDPALDRSAERPLAAELPRFDDPAGWHAMEVQNSVGFRRMRRIDVSRDEVIMIDAEFQDSAAKPGGGRVAVHEYGLTVTADRQTLQVLTIATDPRVLPYRECPSVSANLPRLIGVPLPDLRKAVPVTLAGAAGCTHLNDAFRALAAMPALLPHLD